MRPVNRGDAPRAYTKYQDAIGDLEDRLGTYCSYCERRLPVSLAVEHVNPKSVSPELETVWANFLLGCSNCNSVKGARPTNGDDFLWPDRDNTVLAFTYRAGGFAKVTGGLTDDLRIKAEALRDIVGLDRHRHGTPDQRPAPRDKRWKDREQVWKLATIEKERLGLFPVNVRDLARQFIIEAAEGYGFFSVWMTVFHDDEAVRLALVQRFAGTATDCFDAHAIPRNRPNGRI